MTPRDTPRNKILAETSKGFVESKEKSFVKIALVEMFLWPEKTPNTPVADPGGHPWLTKPGLQLPGTKFGLKPPKGAYKLRKKSFVKFAVI